MTLVNGAFGNALGRIFSAWLSDRLGRMNVLRRMIGIGMVATPALYAAGSNVALLYFAVFVVYWSAGCGPEPFASPSRCALNTRWDNRYPCRVSSAG